jgi:hypothetical protein
MRQVEAADEAARRLTRRAAGGLLTGHEAARYPGTVHPQEGQRLKRSCGKVLRRERSPSRSSVSAGTPCGGVTTTLSETPHSGHGSSVSSV